MIAGFFIGIIERWVAAGTRKQGKGIAVDKVDRRSRKANDMGVKISNNIPVGLINTAVRFITDNQVKKADTKLVKIANHGLVSGKIQAAFAIAGIGSGDSGAGSLGHKDLKTVFLLLGLFHKLVPVGQEQDAFDPSGCHHAFGQGNDCPCFPAACCHDKQRFAAAAVELFIGSFYAFNLIRPPGDRAVNRDYA